MLGQSPGVSHSKSQSSIRHQVRKLRAKVTALIPVDICNKHKKRNERVQQIGRLQNQWKQSQYLKKQQQSIIKGFNTNTPNKLWSKKKELNNNVGIEQSSIPKKSLLYRREFKYNTIDNATSNQQNMKKAVLLNPKMTHGNIVHCHQFQKLSLQEIQQINQDKLYYLGEVNISSYNQFLEKRLGKHPEKRWSKLPEKMISLSNSHHHLRQIVKGGNNEKTKLQKQSSPKQKNYLNWFESYQQNSKTENKIQNDISRISSDKRRTSLAEMKKYPSKKQFRQKSTTIAIRSIISVSQHNNKPKQDRFKNTQARKKYLEDDLKQLKQYTSMNLKLKQNKAAQVRRNLQYENYSKIKSFQKIQQERSMRAKNKKQITLENKGKISEINELLRNRIIQCEMKEQKITKKSKINLNMSLYENKYNLAQI